LLTAKVEPLRRESLLVLPLGAVIISAWYGGLETGLLATFVSAVGLAHLTPTPSSSAVDVVADALRLGVFLLAATLTSWAHKDKARSSLMSRVAGEFLLSEAPNQTLETVCKMVASHLGADVYVHFTVPSDGSGLRIDAYGGVAEEDVRAIIRAGFPLKTGQRADTRTELLRSLGIKAYASFPLVARGFVVGTLSFGARKRSKFRPGELEVMRSVAHQAAVAIERRRAEEERERLVVQLDTERQLLDSVLKTAPVGLAFHDQELRFVRINDVLAEMNGLPPGEHIGRTLWEVLPALAPKLESIYRQVRETGEPILEVELSGETPAAPGQRRHWLASYYPIRDPDGRVLWLGAVVVETTERKRAEEALRQQAHIIDQIHDAVISIDLDGQVSGWNNGAERLFGYAAEEMLGKHFSAVFLAGFALERQLMGPLRAQGNHEMEVQVRRKSGETFDAHVSLSMLRDGEGIPTKMVAYFIDTTAQKRAERERVAALAGVACALHDGCLQTLAGVNLRLESSRELIRRARYAEALAELAHLQAEIVSQHDELRNYVRDLAGVEERRAARRSTSDTHVSVSANFSASSTEVDEVLQIVREAVANVDRHACASSTAIVVWAEDGELRIAVDDDGVGFPADGKPPWSIAFRVDRAGGNVRLERGVPGAHVRIALPQPAA
jgi:PAS domain S-box-containing protein